MGSLYRTLLFAGLCVFVISGADILQSNADPGWDTEQVAGGESETGADDRATWDKPSTALAKVALGNNANAVLSLDLIANGGAGNRRDDGVTTGAVSGRGTKIAIEIFATGVRTPLRGLVLRFDFDASLVFYVKAENSAFALSIPEASVGVNLASTTAVTLAPSGFLARAEFETVTDVTGREFTIGIERVTLAEGSTSSDALTTARVIAFNAAPSTDFDGDGAVGFSDFLALAGSFGSSQGDARYEARFDLDGDGSVAFSDFLIFAAAFGSQVSPSGGGSTVTISDDNLRAVIADSLGKAPNATFTREEMGTLTRIAAPNRGIRDLTGLEHATNLRWLSLGRARVDDEWVNSNHISDLSPLTRLTNLTYLDLTSNRISSISTISNLAKLTQLHLGGNQTISDISALSNLTELTRLNLWDNDISDISAISNLTNLTLLSLSSNPVSSIFALSNLTNLTQLGLNASSISDISALSNLTKLTSLGLGRWRLNDDWDHNDISDLSPLTRLTNLTYLSLTSNRISTVSTLSNLTNLTQLHLGGNRTISDISALSNLTMLEQLNLWGNRISDISALSSLTDLAYLGLSENHIADISPLVDNTGLGDGDTVNLKSNPLSSTSRNTHIPTLQRRGVTVEFDSSNNGGNGGTTTPSGNPDLIVESPSVSDNTLTTGQSFTLRATVRNQGNAAAAATTLRYYRSTNTSISTNDTEVGTDAVSGLSAGGTSAESIGLNAPSDAGTYYYGACVDGVSGESNTDNNCTSGVNVTVSGGSTGGGNLGACRVGLVVRPNQSCTVSGGAFRNIGGGCYNYTPFGSGRFCGSNFNLNGLRGTRVGSDYRITAVP